MTRRWAMLTVTARLPGLTTRMGIRSVAPFGASVGSEGIDTASPRGAGDCAAMTAVGLEITIASPTAVTARRQRGPVRSGDSALRSVVTSKLNHVYSYDYV